jgi:endonuclease YncB( thermonuclease family)
MTLLGLLMFAAVTASPSGETFACTPTRVWDGDGPIWCAEGPRIRLSGIAAREMSGTCRPGQPCPDASAKQSRDALVGLIGRPVGVSSEGHILVSGQVMTCRSQGSAGGSRTAAWCVSPRSGDLSCAMVRGGWALRWDRYWRNHRC